MKPRNFALLNNAMRFESMPFDRSNLLSTTYSYNCFQIRPYIFFPSTFKELKHDLNMWLIKRRERRVIFVKLMKDRYKDTTRKIRRKTRTIRFRPPTRSAFAIKYKRWNKRLRNFFRRRITIKEYSREGWFDSDGYPLTSRDEAGRFVNPWSSESTNGNHPIFKLLSWRMQRLLNTSASSMEDYLQTVPVDFHMQNPDAIRFTWIGHSTCLFQLSGFTAITDPHFSKRASPVQIPLPIGVARRLQPPCDIDDLPFIDVCLITHDHYDHLDISTCYVLKNKVRRWVVPLGLKDWLVEKCHVEEYKIEELMWWQSTAIQNEVGTILKITSAPTQHWSSRTMWDRNQRLWSSFVIEADDKRIFFGGDTGLPEIFPLFTQIGQRLGPFDLAAIPIGAYSPRYFMADSHCDPNEAVIIHKQIRSKKSVAIHWGTFPMAEDLDDEPRKLLEIAAKNHEADFTTIRLGESIEVLGSQK
jgi:N-acyl-phosphatidylethanolamine-hydrolysing phospholipase D